MNPTHRTSDEFPGWGIAGPEGNWDLKGAWSCGASYDGSLQIDRHAELYELSWSVGGEVWRGAALLINGLLLAVRRAAGKRPGLVWYALSAGGELVAFWNASANAERIATGVAKGGQPDSLDGVRQVTYFDPMGNPSPPLRLALRGEGRMVYRATWFTLESREPVYEGIRLAVPNGAIVAWTERGQAADISTLVYTVEPGAGTLRARAVMAGFSGGYGDEVIER